MLLIQEDLARALILQRLAEAQTARQARQARKVSSRSSTRPAPARGRRLTSATARVRVLLAFGASR